jgi:hypothetical protein
LAGCNSLPLVRVLRDIDGCGRRRSPLCFRCRGVRWKRMRRVESGRVEDSLPLGRELGRGGQRVEKLGVSRARFGRRILLLWSLTASPRPAGPTRRTVRWRDGRMEDNVLASIGHARRRTGSSEEIRLREPPWRSHRRNVVWGDLKWSRWKVDMNGLCLMHCLRRTTATALGCMLSIMVVPEVIS